MTLQEENEKLREALEHIVGLSCALRVGGPDPMDLDELSDALDEAVNTAHAALSQLAGPAPLNQCDGCRAGVPVGENGYHRMGKPGEYVDLMYCQRKRYVSESTPEQDEREEAV